MADPHRGAQNASAATPFGSPEAAAAQLSEPIIEVSREMMRSVPPPRGAPFFALDSELPYDLSVLDTFFAQGIFRKYEFALEIGCGLGGRARWLAIRSGCRMVGIDAHLATAIAATNFSRRAHMPDQVSFQVGRFEALPFRDRLFTHVWMIDTGPVVGADVFAEALRVLRRGGRLAIHSEMSAHAAQLCRAVSELGFIELQTREVALCEPPPACRMAAERLRATVAALPEACSLRERLRVHPPAPTALQIFARRPA